jgi:hypothetical protein
MERQRAGRDAVAGQVQRFEAHAVGDARGGHLEHAGGDDEIACGEQGLEGPGHQES